MTHSLSAYTPLESLLLFQYLSVHGVNSDVFTKASDMLKNDAQIKTSANYEPGRLSRDALCDFFLRLLKQEARNEINSSAGADGDGIHADTQANSRKRKAPSPHLPTIQEALKDVHLIPQLINKLYARYKEHAIIEIREDERRYERLDRDVKAIQEGQWDQKIQQQIDGGEFEDGLKQRKLSNGNLSEKELRRTSPGATASPRREELDRKSPPPPDASSPQLGTESPGPRTPQPPFSQYRAHSSSPTGQRSPQAQHGVNIASPRSTSGQSPGMPPPPLPPHPYANQPPYVPHNGLRPGPAIGQYAQPGATSPQVAPVGGVYQPHPNNQQHHPQMQYPTPVHPSQRGGVQLPPFQVTPQTPPTAKQQQTSQGISKSAALKTGELASASGTHGRSTLTPIDVARLLMTTDSPSGSGRSTPSSTRWKSSSLSRSHLAPGSPTRPRSRSVSPISDGERTPDQSPPTVKTSTRRTRSHQASVTRSTSATETVGPSRTTRTQGRRVRGGSTTSSVVGGSTRGRTRSQSVLSHASVDNESLTGRKVKPEPSTPMEITETVEVTPVSSGQPTTRRSVLPATSNKRKRELRGTSEASDDATEAPQRPAPSAPKDKVLAVRNFSRLAMPMIENILSHKHASLFSNPVRDRDAHGYSDMIRRPQDMKSIKAAITAGGRAVNAAATAADESLAGGGGGGPHDASSVLLLPAAEELVPPRGIVNSAQLEREVMRMFANAVMFNAGEDDVVHDAREMYESAAVSIANFRSAERTAAAEAERRRLESSDADEHGEDDGASATGTAERSSKRRAMA